MIMVNGFLILSLTSLPGITPPQKPTSTKTFPVAAEALVFRFSNVVVGGIEFLKLSDYMTIIINL